MPPKARGPVFRDGRLARRVEFAPRGEPPARGHSRPPQPAGPAGGSSSFIDLPTSDPPDGQVRSPRERPLVTLVGQRISGLIGTLALAVWKFKFAAVLLASKAKFLLLGLTKASTFLSMFLRSACTGRSSAAGSRWDWFFRFMSTRWGMWPCCCVRSSSRRSAVHTGTRGGDPDEQAFTDPRQDARVGLAGPIWGLGAAIVCAIVPVVTGQPIWAALARFGAWINLFNLMPIWQLDGGRAFRSPEPFPALAGDRGRRHGLGRH